MADERCTNAEAHIHATVPTIRHHQHPIAMFCHTLLRLLVASQCLGLHSIRISAQATTPTEFPKGWRFPLELSQGPTPNTGTYAGWLSVGAMRTVLPGHLRAGVLLAPGLFGSQATGIGGARLAWRVRTFTTTMGSWGNLQLAAEHLWSTQGAALVGGGLGFEAGELILAGLKAYLPYTTTGTGPVWLQFSIGLHLCRGKASPESEDPFSNP